MVAGAAGPKEAIERKDHEFPVGTGLFTIAKMEGRYEAQPKENGGKNYLTWYDKANGPHKMGTIIKVTKDELHIKEPGGNGLFVWKRL